ncbi:putative leader peptide [Nocardioides okcheonensis]|nr:putative leader peptide [Nocardioides okcheonensis]
MHLSESAPATVGDLLTQRRAVDLVRTGSALCRRPTAD